MRAKRSTKPSKFPALLVRGKADRVLVGLTLFLSLFGLVMVYNASTVEAFRDFGDKLYFLKNQMTWLFIGWVGLFFVSFLNHHWLRRLALPLLGFNLFLLVLVLIPGVGMEIKGAKRWLSIGGFVFQPTEMLKSVLVAYLAIWLEEKRSLGAFLLLVGVVLGLVILQPDLGTAIVIVGSAFLVYYLSGAQVFHFILLSLLMSGLGFGLIWSSNYRRERLKTFLDPTADPLGSSYHIRQVLISLGSGGVTGIGLGQSRQKYQYLPEATTDSIFAVVAEETGFVGGIVLLGAFLALVSRGFKIAQESKELFGRLVAGGITSWIGLQVLVNLAAMVVLVPLTGIPLPLISYGGSSLVVTLVSVGVLLSISRYNKS